MNSYHIPANFTDSGRLFGLFPIRNTIEAVLLTIPLFFMLFSCLPFSLTANIIVTMIFVVPVGGFAMIGINDDSLTRFLLMWLRFLKRRRILTYRGGSDIEA